ncbi:hypothetical protein UFOVP71_382 [uncultured Caudovirales phage]|uniref:Uncharacterized protein n=1 Tax=uncultured Caudovirales phage TaxID=2100421 RepID=A0A6J5TBX8_9CAUD|nr:hypothetical protein UFOVP71_382 [uncultured Caudovirales phage]
MELWIKLIPRLVSGLLSIVDASSLRNRVHQIEDEHELMWTALDDIARMNKDTPAGEHARRTLSNVNTRYGR